MAEPAPAPAGAACEHLARTTSYFDGALSRAEEEAAALHLAGCAECQAILGDAIGIDVALGGQPAPPAAQPVPPAAPGRRWRRSLVVAAIAAIAVVAALWIGERRQRPAAPAPAVVAIALPAQRAREARFTGARFAPHRELGAPRGDRAREAIVPAAMAELERRAEPHDLVAALAAAGELARAEQVAAGLPAGAAAESDRAALALARGDLEGALRHAYRAIDREPGLAAARWNLALAARGLRLPRVARAAFERVAAAGEPGWAAEAGPHIAALTRDIAAEEAPADIEARGQAMSEGGPPLPAADVAVAPALARLSFHDALRMARDPARLEALRPLAAALDAHAGTRHAAAMLDRADPALGERFGAAYRKIFDDTATAEDVAKLLAELRAAGPRADYLRVGVMLMSSHVRPDWRELQAATAPWQDPWFELLVERERIRATWSANDIDALPALEAAIARCAGAAWSLRCGNLAIDLAQLRSVTGRDDLAAAHAAAAAARYREAGSRGLRVRASAFVAELHRNVGAIPRARAEFEEAALAAPESECDVRRYAQIVQAALAADDEAWDAARALLPPAEPPARCTVTHDVNGLATAVELARRSGDARDVDVARRWIERTGRPGSGGFAVTALARIARGTDPAAARLLETWVQTNGIQADAELRAARAWAFATLVSDAGVRGDWAHIFELAALRHPVAAHARCALVAGVDLDEITVAARAEAALSGSHRRVALADFDASPIVPDAIVAALSGCDEIAVVAWPPLHARADLLPARLPWWFAGDTPGAAPRPGAARSLEVTDTRPPDPSLPPLPRAPSGEPFDATLTGADATPPRVLAALAGASYAELHVHAVAATSALDSYAPYLALSPDRGGAFALRAPAVRTTPLSGAPVVVLAAARGAVSSPRRRALWTLPDAFLAAGASAVVAADAPPPDAAARAALDDLRRRLARGEPVARAVAAVRAAAPAGAWARRLIVFR